MSGRLEGRLVGLGITGSIAAYKAPELVRALQAEGVAASLWQLQPLPAQPVFRRNRLGPWRPGDDGPLGALEVYSTRPFAFDDADALESEQDRRENVEEARRHLEAALAIHREVGNRRNEGVALGNHGWLRLEQGALDEARAALEEALAIAREVGNRRNEGADRYLEDALALFTEQGWHWAFYSFREDDWDGMDYELGAAPPNAAYWQALEAGRAAKPMAELAWQQVEKILSRR